MVSKKGAALSSLEKFYNYLLNRKINPKQIQGSINHYDENQFPELLKFATQYIPSFKVYTIEIPFSDSKNIAKDLADAIAKGVNYLAKVADHGLDLELANRHLQFSIKIGPSYFLEIAKTRALKILWANVLEAYDLKEIEMPDIEAHFSSSAFGEDPNTNMIRSTTQAMSAVLGGVNRLTILPSDLKSGNTTEFSRRIARNVQHLLMMESLMDRVIDPAKGSYYIEKLTEKIATAAWAEFQKMV